MVDRITFPSYTATAHGAFRAEFDGVPSSTADGVPIWVIVLGLEVEDRFRPIPLRVDTDVRVPLEREPHIKDGQAVEFSQFTVRAARRKSGELYLALSADSVKVVAQ